MGRLRRRWWQPAQGEDGLGLIEMVIALFVVSIALMALGSVVITTLISLRTTRDREQATNAASSAIEQVRARDFTDIAHDGNASLPVEIQDELDATSDPTCAEGEPLVRDGAVTDPIDFHRSTGNNDVIDVYTVITWIDATCGNPGGDTKRVIALATWVDGDTREWVRQETDVVEVERGLPVPEFRVQPDSGTVRMTQAQANDPDEFECVAHRLRNLGAADTYEWELTKTEQDGAPFKDTGHSYRTPNGKWEVTGYLELSEEATAEYGERPVDADARMEDTNGNGRMGSDLEVPSGAMANFTVCWEVEDSSADSFPVEVTVFSQFDDRKNAVLEHELLITDAVVDFFLLDWDDSAAHTRCQGDPCAIGPLRMSNSLQAYDEADPNQLSYERLGRADYTDPDESNWSTEISGLHLPGVQLLPGSVSDAESTLSWHYQFHTASQLQPMPELTLYVAPTAALDPNQSVGDELDLRFDVRLDGLNSDEDPDNPIWAGEAEAVVVPYSDEDTGTPWRQVTIPFDDLTAPVDFARNEYLRLRVTCRSDSDDDCNLAYDSRNETTDDGGPWDLAAFLRAEVHR